LDFDAEIGGATARQQPWPTLFLHRGGNQFLETRILAQWFKHWFEPEQRRSERRVRDGEQVSLAREARALPRNYSFDRFENL
jgi:hypothetical protein